MVILNEASPGILEGVGEKNPRDAPIESAAGLLFFVSGFRV